MLLRLAIKALISLGVRWQVTSADIRNNWSLGKQLELLALDNARSRIQSVTVFFLSLSVATKALTSKEPGNVQEEESNPAQSL